MRNRVAPLQLGHFAFGMRFWTGVGYPPTLLVFTQLLSVLSRYAPATVSRSSSSSSAPRNHFFSARRAQAREGASSDRSNVTRGPSAPPGADVKFPTAWPSSHCHTSQPWTPPASSRRSADDLKGTF